VLDPFYNAVAWLIVHIHSGMGSIFGPTSGASWALSIVLLTMAMRLLLFPLFVKQIKSQRAMSALQPQMKELQAKYKNDKEKLNQEMMALWREAGTNPLAGCLPVIVQIPVFFALFKVLNSLHPNKGCTDVNNIAQCFSGHFNNILNAHLTHDASVAKVFGVPIGASFSSSSHTLSLLHANATSVKLLSVILIVVMAASTFITQRQLMARNAASGVAQMPQQQKTLLYVLPVVFALFGFKFPLGVLLYWLTTNFWSMAQQAVVIRRMDMAPAATGPSTTVAGPAPGARPDRVRPARTALVPDGDAEDDPAPDGSNGAATPTTNGTRPAARPPVNRNRKKRKGGRR
jgi:YidC/Oxa1 family membrane protein insertase